MEKIIIGDITCRTHNKREALWCKNLQSKVEVLSRYLDNPSELKDYTLPERVGIIKRRIDEIHYWINSGFWLDIINEPISIYTEHDFRKHFMFRR